ncbi:hypothetical protein [Spirosoma fluviale]|uniref:hypothetical protein n=1 Tax=Spirosoma fluviale TaxID=1597977 RepID=UPI000BE388E8|nr:hypothetical protein [Spirosoma fluviale]
MNYRQLTGLTLVIGSSFLGSACSKTNLVIPAAPTAALVNKQGEDSRPLFFVNNVEVKDFKQAKIGPNDIESINVLKPSATNDLVSTYGPKAKNGVIFVTTKRAK